MRLTMALPIWAICLLCFSAVSEQSPTPAPNTNTGSNAPTATDPLSKEPESAEDSKMPPKVFPEEKAVPFTPGKLPGTTSASEAADMMKADQTSTSNETDRVDHPNVKDPGTTHQEDTDESQLSQIQACLLPPMAETEFSASDWLRDGGNVSKLCSLPLDWLNSSSNGTIHVCSIPKDVWEKNYKGVTDGKIPKEILKELNDPNVTCVTPNDDLSNNSSDAKKPIANGTIPSAWLRDSKDNIYIYIIPREWLKGAEEDSATASSVAPAVPAATVASSAGNVTVANTTADKQANVTQAPTMNATEPTPTSVNQTSNSTAAGNSTVVPVSPTTTASPNATAAANATLITPVASTAPANSTTLAPVASGNSSANNTVAAVATTVLPSSAVPAAPTATTPSKPADTPTTTATKTPATPATKTPATTTTASTTTTAVTAGNSTASPQAPRTGTRPADAENEVEGVHSATPAALSQQHESHDHASNGKTAFLQPTESAAILAGVFVAIAILGYAGLLVWRRVLERRYGHREMLVNEDDDFDTSDMRHFEL